MAGVSRVPERDEGNPLLLAWLHDEIRRRGPIPFAEYMQAALHHPEFGYYAKPEPIIAPEGDFLTAPALHPAFGRTLWRQVREMLALAGPGPHRILEVGAGGGHMARDLLEAARADGFGAGRLEYVIVEQSARLVEQQRARLAAAWPGAPVRWAPSLDAAGPVHVVLTNEVMSAFPVHRLVWDPEAGWRELYVGLRDGRPSWEHGPVSEPRAPAALRDAGIAPVPGQVYDVNVGAGDLLRDLARRLARRAFVVTVDYGGPAAEVYRPGRRAGSLRCYYRQRQVDDPFARPGRQDITADLDFTLLERVGREVGLRSLGLLTQGSFLLRLGIEEEARALAARARRGDGGAERELQRVYALYAPEALGDRFWVLVQCRGFLRPPRLTGLAGPAPRPARLDELILSAGAAR